MKKGIFHRRNALVALPESALPPPTGDPTFGKEEYRIVVRENKVPLVLGWVLIAVGVVIEIVYALAGTGSDGFAGFLLLEVPTLLAAVGCFMDYCLRRLTIEGGGCCYCSMFGRIRLFSEQDIKCVRLYTRGYDTFISLVDGQGQVLVRLEKNMVGAGELLSYLEKRDVPISESDESSVNNLEYYEDAAKNGEQFYQTPAWKKRIRILRNLLSVVGILLFFVTWLILPLTLSAWVYIGYPLAIYVFYLVFHGVITIGKPNAASKEWEQTHITLPCLGLALLLVRALNDVNLLTFRGFDPFAWFPLAAVPLAVLYFLIVRPKSAAVCALAVMLIAAYSMTVPAYINVALTTGSPEHEVAVVTHKNDYRSGKYTRGYEVDVYPQNETFEVDSGLYASVDEGDVVYICKRTSIFGGEYCMVHQ